ncbi:MAG: AraC family transcriptional regulator [Planctomycetota bacterium]
MRLNQINLTDDAFLWRVEAYGQTEAPAGKPYWHKNDQREPAHRWVVEHVTQGTMTFRSPAGDQPIPADHIVIFAYGSPTAYGHPPDRPPSHPGHQTRYALLTGAGLHDHLHALAQRHGHRFPAPNPSPAYDAFQHLLTHADPAAQTPTLELSHAVHHLVFALFDTADRLLRDRLSPVDRAIHRILHQPHQPGSLDEIAHEADCSREHLSRSFKQQVGTPPHTYLTRKRLERALRLLERTSLPLADVAQQAGLPSTTTLTRLVRQATNLPPTQYRQQHHH